MSEFQYCCIQFKNIATWPKNESGFIIEVRRVESGALGCFLKFKAVDDLEGFTYNSQISICLQAEIGILYCPWCRTRLASYYRHLLGE